MEESQPSPEGEINCSDDDSSMEIISISKESEEESATKLNETKRNKESDDEVVVSVKESLEEIEIKPVNSVQINSKDLDVKADSIHEPMSVSETDIKEETPIKIELVEDCEVTVKLERVANETCEPPPVKRIKEIHIMQLESNPLTWTEDDVHKFLISKDCARFAKKFKEELIDGQAFMMLNLPTLLDHLYIQHGHAMKLCQLIEQVKLAYYVQFFLKRNKDEEDLTTLV